MRLLCASLLPMLQGLMLIDVFCAIGMSKDIRFGFRIWPTFRGQLRHYLAIGSLTHYHSIHRGKKKEYMCPTFLPNHPVLLSSVLTFGSLLYNRQDLQRYTILLFSYSKICSCWNAKVVKFLHQATISFLRLVFCLFVTHLYLYCSRQFIISSFLETIIT